jgi:hypoxanthine phosphoribosyltransferase
MEVITLNKQSFSNTCEELASKIDFRPDLVVGILNGGGYVVNELKQNNYKQAYFKLINFKRKTGFMDFFASPFILSLFPNKILNKLRTYKAINAKKSIRDINLEELSNFKLNFKLDESLKKNVNSILIIDDAIDTGRVMFVVKNNLIDLFPTSQIKTAVISWTIENSIEKPDYYIFKNVLVRFPWSKDYKQKDVE